MTDIIVNWNSGLADRSLFSQNPHTSDRPLHLSCGPSQ